MIKNLRYKWNWLNILNSPFIWPKMIFYFGKIERGVPYFLPRRWRNLTYDEARESVLEDIKKRIEVSRKVNKEYKVPNRKEIQSLIKSQQYSQKPYSTKWQIQSIGLGYKSKWDSWRHEWNPMISIVGFNRQFCIYFGQRDSMTNTCYWEAYLYYHKDTRGTTEERVRQCREKASMTWGNNEKGYTDYYNIILKKKWKNIK